MSQDATVTKVWFDKVHSLWFDKLVHNFRIPVYITQIVTYGQHISHVD